MMEFLVAVLSVGLELGFAYLFFSTFLSIRCSQDRTLPFLLCAWLAGVLYRCLSGGSPGIDYVYLLTLVLMLLCLFSEEGWAGLGLLVLALLLHTALDAIFSFHPLASIAGRLLALGIPLVIRSFRGGRQKPDASQDMLLRQNMELQAESIAALSQSYRLQRKSVHEFEHHLQVLSGLLEQKQHDAAQSYLQQLKQDRSMQSMAVNSHHPVIDVILNQKYQTARENGIRMQIQVNDLSSLGIPTNDLAVILTNLLDNAIEACRGLDGCREIVCSFLLEDGLYLSIRNTSDPVTVQDGRIPTSKADSLSHGFGLLSVSYLLDKLDAEYTLRYEEGWFHFAAEILP